MKRNNLIKEIILLAILFAPIIFMLVQWNNLPDRLPIHWNIKGEIDGYGSKFVFPILSILIYLLLLIIPKIDPRKKNYTIFSSSYYKLRLILTIFFSTLFFLVLINVLYTRVDFEKLIPISVLFLFAIIGNYLGTIRSNYFVGIRTPWTLNNEKVWNQTHRISGKIWVAGGVIGGLVTIFINRPFAQFFAFGLIIAMGIFSVAYSYLYYRRLEQKGEIS